MTDSTSIIVARAEVRKILDGLRPAANGPAARSTINVVAGQRHLAADQGITALVNAGVPFYQRNRALQRIALIKAKNMSGKEMLVPGIISIDTPMMTRELGRC